MPGPFPDILEQEVIPPPLHGVNPRTIMGAAAWSRVKREVYAKHGYICAACGIPSHQAIILQRLEAHERYHIDYALRRMHLTSIEPVCHACHGFVHAGLLEVKLAKRAITRARAETILRHGISTLRTAGLRIPQAQANLCAALSIRHDLTRTRRPMVSGWSGWSMVWEGRSYPSPYPTEQHWRRAMSSRNTA